MKLLFTVAEMSYIHIQRLINSKYIVNSTASKASNHYARVKLLPLKCVTLRITTFISWRNNPQTFQQHESTHIIFRSPS